MAAAHNPTSTLASPRQSAATERSLISAPPIGRRPVICSMIRLQMTDPVRSTIAASVPVRNETGQIPGPSIARSAICPVKAQMPTAVRCASDTVRLRQSSAARAVSITDKAAKKNR